MTATPILEVEQLVVGFPARRAITQVIKGVSFTLAPGETLGLVGESGSGKTTIGRAILGLAPVRSGAVRFRGTELSALSPRARRTSSRRPSVRSR